MLDLSALHRARASPRPRRYSGRFRWRQRHFRSARMANHFLCPVRTTRAHAYEISWTSLLNPLVQTDLTTSSMWTVLLDGDASNPVIPLPDHFECATTSSPLSKHRSPGSDSIQ